jgi:hypothetical protein
VVLLIYHHPHREVPLQLFVRVTLPALFGHQQFRQT